MNKTRKRKDPDPRGRLAAMDFVENFADNNLDWENLKFFPFEELKELRRKAQRIRRKFRRQK